MESIPLLWAGEQVGEITGEPEGLYTRRRVRYRRTRPGLWYAWLIGGAGELRLGVLEPVSGGLSIRRRLSRRELEPLGTLVRGEVRDAAAVSLWESMTRPQFRTPYLREQLQGKSGLLTKPAGQDCRWIAVPYEERAPFPLAAMFCLARVLRIRGRRYAAFAFDPQEFPVLLPETSETQEKTSETRNDKK